MTQQQGRGLKVANVVVKIIALLIIVPVVIAVLGKFFTCEPQQVDSSVGPVASETAPAKVSPVYEIGKPFRLGDFVYVVESIQAIGAIGKNRLARVKAGEGAVFLVVEYTIKNMGKETATVLSDDFKIIDTQGRTFRPSSEANTALMMSGDSKDFILSEIQPGLKRKMRTAFEVPEPTDATPEKGVLASRMKLAIPEKGILGSGMVEVPFLFAFRKKDSSYAVYGLVDGKPKFLPSESK